jgi:hypothetical protein
MMKVGDIVRNRNSESGELGVFMGLRTFDNGQGGKPYTCAEVFWPERRKVGSIQTNMIEKIDESR